MNCVFNSVGSKSSVSKYSLPYKVPFQAENAEKSEKDLFIHKLIFHPTEKKLLQ